MQQVLDLGYNISLVADRHFISDEGALRLDQIVARHYLRLTKMYDSNSERAVKTDRDVSFQYIW